MIHAIRLQMPLILNITNYVVMNSSANALLAIGASPIMAHASEELSDLISIANALVINCGTLDQQWIKSTIFAVNIAFEKKIPIVFDPVGAGASAFRTQIALQLLQTKKISVLRGNASEIISLDQKTQSTKGVDSQHQSHDAILSANNISKKYGCIVVISGKIDYCISKNELIEVTGGSDMVQFVTGMGCIATTIIAACISINSDALQGCFGAMTCMKRCVEKASIMTNAPGTFFTNFLDALFLYEK